MVSPESLSTAYNGVHRQPSSRQLSRAMVSRSGSRRSSAAMQSSTSRDRGTAISRQYSPGDSSDDEVPEPKFSASVKALLDEDGLGSSPRLQNGARERTPEEGRALAAAAAVASSQERRHSQSPRLEQLRDRANGSPAPRVVRIGSALSNSRSRREGSVLSNSEYQQQQQQQPPQEPEERHSPNDFITPAPRHRSVRLSSSRSHTRSPGSVSPSQRRSAEPGSGSDRGSAERLSEERKSRYEDDHAPRVGASSVLRSRHGDEAGPHSSLRVKRVGRLTGAFLNGPARRGVLRRHSEEHHDDQYYSPDGNGGEDYHQEPHDHAEYDYKSTARSSPKVSWADPSPAHEENHRHRSVDPGYHHNHHHHHQSGDEAPYERMSSPKSYGSHSKSTPGSSSEMSSKSSSAKEQHQQPVFKVPPLPPMPSARDQENEPPPTFKRSRPQGLNLLDKPERMQSAVYGEDKKDNGETPATTSPRRILATRSNNTPHRPAPPPPKMSVLETATTGAGAATASQSRKKRSQVAINHKAFTRLDCIGRGGSSRVYRVMAENYKIFALKRVNLEDVDPLTLAGYKGEIDLLKKLENLDRVVRLFDFELNSDKHTLSVLMEIGESDLEKILAYRLNSDDATLDINFTRYYWKEMLECVRAVHEYNVVHSDLKPANFLLVQGRLKLIDFGIANAIQDNTVNVHREQQVGTPNYMSPEALVDSNASLGLPSSVGKMMKLGKPSDVWSLGCILYKMVYGQPPFAKIAKYYERIMAIPNPRVQIDFPEFGVGGVPVPPGLIRTLKRCLQRDQTLRPTVEELLGQHDPFLYPDAQMEGAVPISQDMLNRILVNVVNHCRVRGIPKEEELATWPAGFFAKIKAALEEEAR